MRSLLSLVLLCLFSLQSFAAAPAKQGNCVNGKCYKVKPIASVSPEAAPLPTAEPPLGCPCKQAVSRGCHQPRARVVASFHPIQFVRGHCHGVRYR